MKCKFIVFTVLAIVTLSFATRQTAGSDGERGPKENHHLTRNDISVIQAEERKARRKVREATKLVFNTIRAELGVRFIHGFGKGDKRCRIVTDDVEKKVYETYEVSVGTFFDVDSIIQPKAFSIVAKARAIAFAGLKAAVAGIIDAVSLIDEYHGDQVRMKINKIEKETVEVSANVMRTVYVPILKGYDSSTAIGAKLLRAEDKTVSAIIRSIRGIFYGTRSVLAKLFPNVDFGVSHHFSFDTIENNTIAGFYEVVSSVYEADSILLNAYSTKTGHTSGYKSSFVNMMKKMFGRR